MDLDRRRAGCGLPIPNQENGKQEVEKGVISLANEAIQNKLWIRQNISYLLSTCHTPDLIQALGKKMYLDHSMPSGFQSMAQPFTPGPPSSKLPSAP